MSIIKKIPLPFSGVMLSCFVLGNLLKTYHNNLYFLFSSIGCFLFVFISLKIITDFKSLLQDLKHPVISSVLPTYTMGMMLLSAFIKVNFEVNTLGMWYLAIILHGLLIVNYSLRFILNFNLQKIFPSIFVVYVGVVVSSVTGPLFNLSLGRYAFYFGLVFYFLTLAVIIFRLFKHKAFPEPAKPTLAIMAAPASLLLAGYQFAFAGNMNTGLLYLLLVFSLGMYAFVFIKLPKLLSLKFSPGFAAFTFPMVISALAVKKVSVYLDLDLLLILANIQTFIATLILIYVLSRYMLFLFYNPQKDPAKRKAS